MTATKAKCLEIKKALGGMVEALMVAKAMAAVERERVDAIERGLLESQVFYGRKPNGEQFRVVEPKHGYLMDEESFSRYHSQLSAIHLRNGFADAAKGWCPALVAERLVTECEWALIAAAGEFFPGVTNDKLLCAKSQYGGGLETRAKFIELVCGLCLSKI